MMTKRQAYEVYAIRYATVERRSGENFLGGDPHDAGMPMDYFVWVAKNAEKTWVIDTGFNAEAADRRKRQFLRSPVEGMQLLGVEAAPEDVNIFEQVYASVRSGGYVTTAGFPRGNVNSRLVAWNNKTISGGNFPGLNVLSDLPKFISLVERGMFDAKSMIGKVYGPDEMLEALVGAVSREVLTTVVDLPSGTVFLRTGAFTCH
jgi:threonine dehydrogenase-like Zn-dependent dehydrogenase